jgi:hypothetical protein
MLTMELLVRKTDFKGWENLENHILCSASCWSKNSKLAISSVLNYMLPNKPLNRLNRLMLCKEELLNFFSILREISDTLFQVRYKPISHFLPCLLSLASALLVAATGSPFHLITDQENYLLINQTAISLAICFSRCRLSSQWSIIRFQPESWPSLAARYVFKSKDKIISFLAIMVDLLYSYLFSTFFLSRVRVGSLFIVILHLLCVNKWGWTKLLNEFQNLYSLPNIKSKNMRGEGQVARIEEGLLEDFGSDGT